MDSLSSALLGISGYRKLKDQNEAIDSRRSFRAIYIKFKSLLVQVFHMEVLSPWLLGPDSEADQRMFALLCIACTSVLIYLVLLLSNRKRRMRDPNDIFHAKKKIGVKEEVLLQMLFETRESNQGACFVITDPDLDDNAIIYASPGFCAHTQYTKKEVEGRNCRFLQGDRTDPKDVKVIRDAISENREVSVELLNYKKSGEPFLNQFFLLPLKKAGENSVAYYLGVQCELKESMQSAGWSQQGKNPGWRIFHWL